MGADWVAKYTRLDCFALASRGVLCRNFWRPSPPAHVSLVLPRVRCPRAGGPLHVGLPARVGQCDASSALPVQVGVQIGDRIRTCRDQARTER